MLTKRIIPCLDIKDGRTVKGTNFVNLKDAGDPVELAKKYADTGADELVFLDISATIEARKTLLNLVNKVAHAINIPFTVGGGISKLEDVNALLNEGADKVSINSAAIKNPQIIAEFANEFGSQCIVIAIDSKKYNGQDYVFSHGGTKKTDLITQEWAKNAENLGAGEILLTSMDHDGTKNGFANVLNSEISSSIKIPLIASGGAGTKEDFKDGFLIGKADAALAASIFHYQEVEIPALKQYLSKEGIPIRI